MMMMMTNNYAEDAGSDDDGRDAMFDNDSDGR